MRIKGIKKRKSGPIDPYRVPRLLTLTMTIGFLFLGLAVGVVSPSYLTVSMVLWLFAVVLLVKLCTYPRVYVRCELCGQKVPNEVHHLIAHANSHIGRGEY
jgi:hypothetical protein